MGDYGKKLRESKFYNSFLKDLDNLAGFDFCKSYFNSFEVLDKMKKLENDEKKYIGIEIMINSIKLFEEKESLSKIIRIDDELIPIIENTKNKVFYRKLPYPMTFLDNDFFVVKDKKEYKIKGLIVVEHYKDDEECFFVMGVGFNEVDTFLINFFVEKNLTVIPKNLKSLLENVCSIIDILNEKKDIIYYEKKFDSEQEKKRQKKGKTYRNDKTIIKAGINLKAICEDFNKSKAKYKINVKYLVKGHMRHFKAKRYKDVKDKKIWIKPFFKGTGEIIKKKVLIKK